MSDAGRLLIIPKGKWKRTVAYEMLDLVYHSGTSWISKKASQDIEPKDANDEYWQKLFDPDEYK